jgi:hypothetical protein
MASIAIRRTTVMPAGDADMLVEILLSDAPDIDKSQEHVALTVKVPASENPGIQEVRHKALRRAQYAIQECIDALAPSPSA